mmetsp:Transcript_117/g.323  ORF Transcript_117/g.323 Transcript_117/m.323 type:complete len:217 (-) Transcript_117:757-1407(-)
MSLMSTNPEFLTHQVVCLSAARTSSGVYWIRPLRNLSLFLPLRHVGTETVMSVSRIDSFSRAVSCQFLRYATHTHNPPTCTTLSLGKGTGFSLRLCGAASSFLLTPLSLGKKGTVSLAEPTRPVSAHRYSICVANKPSTRMLSEWVCGVVMVALVTAAKVGVHAAMALALGKRNLSLAMVASGCMVGSRVMTWKMGCARPRLPIIGTTPSEGPMNL